ncbi:MAG: DUF3800 domain-containing protein [Pseudomonadota bacterium]
MYLFYGDETNLEHHAGDFLIYGGLVAESGQAHALSLAIDALRREHGVPRDYRMKFNPGPEGFSHQQFISLKQAALEAAVEHGARMIAYVILHDIATNSDEARRNGINTVCYHFNCILNCVGGPGLVLIDRFNDQGNQIDAHLRDKFSVGLTGMPYTAEMRLENIIGFHYSAIGQSHMPSLVDIALGSLRFAINTHTRNQEANRESANNLLGLLGPLFWREGDAHAVPEIGFLFSPKVIWADRYRTQYESLKAFLHNGGIPTSQQITKK